MSVADQTVPGGNDATAGGQSEESKDQTKNTTVSREAYEKVLTEAKAAKARAAQLETEKSATEKAKLEESGQFKELHAKLQSEFEEFKSGTKQREANFAYRTISSQFKEEALKAGCLRPEALEKLVDLKELKGAVDSETYTVDSTALKKLVEKAAKENDFLFGKQAPHVSDVPMQGGKGVQGSFESDLKAAKTQREFDAVLAKYGKI